MTATEISKKSGLAKTTLTAMLVRMQEQRLVRIEKNANDRRSALVCLTEKTAALKDEYQRKRRPYGHTLRSFQRHVVDDVPLRSHNSRHVQYRSDPPRRRRQGRGYPALRSQSALYRAAQQRDERSHVEYRDTQDSHVVAASYHRADRRACRSDSSVRRSYRLSPSCGGYSVRGRQKTDPSIRTVTSADIIPERKRRQTLNESAAVSVFLFENVIAYFNVIVAERLWKT